MITINLVQISIHITAIWRPRYTSQLQSVNTGYASHYHFLGINTIFEKSITSNLSSIYHNLHIVLNPMPTRF